MTQDTYASDIDACEPLDTVDNLITEENVDVLQEWESNRVIKKVDNLPNLNYSADAITQIVIDKPCDEKDVDATNFRDVRSSTVYSRSDSENPNIIYHKSISSDSTSTYNESNADYHQRPIYDRTDSSSSFIQGELDSEEYHHNHRFSVTAETLEYIRGRDDWRAHTGNKFEKCYSRQSSNISIREEIDSDEYHHERELSDLIEIAYLDSESIRSLPSSFEDNKVFDRYYLELQQINGQLSSDIEQHIAQKQVILLDSNEIEAAEGYMYPLPDIILDQVSDHGDESYAIEQVDSDYSNLSDSEDSDIQSVIEVNHGRTYEGEIITTLDMDGDVDDMIEVTLWDLNDDRESSVEIISISNENLIGEQVYAVQSDELLLARVASEPMENLHADRSADKLKDATTPKETNIIESPIESGAQLQINTENNLLRTLQPNRDRSPAIEISKSFIEQENLSLVRESTAAHSQAIDTKEMSTKKTKSDASHENLDDLIKDVMFGVWFHN